MKGNGHRKSRSTDQPQGCCKFLQFDRFCNVCRRSLIDCSLFFSSYALQLIVVYLRRKQPPKVSFSGSNIIAAHFPFLSSKRRRQMGYDIQHRTGSIS